MVLEVVGTATDLQVHGLTQQLGQSVSRQHHGGWEEALQLFHELFPRASLHSRPVSCTAKLRLLRIHHVAGWIYMTLYMDKDSYIFG
jgi:hypothetical protein